MTYCCINKIVMAMHIQDIR